MFYCVSFGFRFGLKCVSADDEKDCNEEMFLDGNENCGTCLVDVSVSEKGVGSRNGGLLLSKDVEENIVLNLQISDVLESTSLPVCANGIFVGMVSLMICEGFVFS